MLEIIRVDTWTLVKNYTDSVYSISWSPDGKYLAYSFSSVNVIDTQEWSVVHNCSVNASDISISWSPDGKYLAYGAAFHAGIIDTSTWSKTRELALLSDFSKIEALEWSPDSRYLVGGEILIGNKYSGIPDKGAIQIWNTDNWENEHVVNTGDEKIPFSLSWNPNRPILAVGLDSGYFSENAIPELELISTENWTADKEIEPINKTELSSLEKEIYWMHFYSVAWSPDGNSLAVGYKDVVVYTTEKGLFTEEQETEDTGYSFGTVLIGSMAAMTVAGVWYRKSKR